MTGLALYGELNDGYVFKTSIALAKNLLRDDCFVLPAIGKLIPFEIAIGINGIVWVNSKTTRNTTIIANAILNSESMTESEVNVMVAQLTENADLE
jgi:exosome complex component RRP40